jgi:hypothetical protein
LAAAGFERGEHRAMMRDLPLAATGDLDRDLEFLETYRWGRKEFADRLCQASKNSQERILSHLRSEAAYQFTEFYYLLRARGIETADDIRNFAELHNQYIVQLTKDAEKMARLGLKKDRLLDAMFTADTMPRLLQNWAASPGSLDQSNLARFLVSVMSTETCRKLVVAIADAGFLKRDKTHYGTIVVSSTGVLENIFGSCIREMRLRIQKG